MWLSRRLQLCVLLMMAVIAECYPRMNTRTLQTRGSSASQQLLESPIPLKISDPVPQRRPKNIDVQCHEDSMEILMHADLFATGIPVHVEELRLGPDSMMNKVSGASCGAVQSGENELTIFAYFRDCGTTLSVSLCFASTKHVAFSTLIVWQPSHRR